MRPGDSLWQLSRWGGGADHRLRDYYPALTPSPLSPADAYDVFRAFCLQHEAELHKLSLAVGQSPISVVIFDTGGIVEYVNPTFTDITGIPRADAMGNLLGIDDDFRTIIMLADPFSTPITRLLPAITGYGGPDRPIPVVGGMSSGASQPGHNAMVIDDKPVRNGAVGVTISGKMAVDIIVSQGCRPVGKPIVVTKAKGNVIQELGGRQALDCVQEMAGELGEEERELLSAGLLVGTVINEYKARFGRGDFLVRNLLGYDKQHGAIAVGDMPRVGQTVQFHVRDAETAHEDLQLLLDGQQLDDTPLGALLITCNGRGSRLFENEDSRDVQTIRSRLGEIPLAGFFAAGEIGPIGDESFLHGHTASLAIFRAT